MTCDCCGSANWEYCFNANGLDLGRCPSCGLYYVRQAQLAAFQHYEDTGILLDARIQMDDEMLRVSEFEEYIRTIAPFAPAGKWLDMGCGTGVLIKLAIERGIVAEGIELTPSRAALAREVSNAPIHEKPLEDLNLPNGSLAVVIAVNVFSHLRPPSKTLTEISRVLAPGGVLMMVTGEVGPGLRKEHNFSWPLGEELYYLGSDSIDVYNQKLGFKLVQRSRTWLPDFLYGEQRFREHGKSRLRNLAKTAILHTPGALPLLRSYMFRKQRDNPVYSATLVLQKKGL
jgi:SAM-dependent methyltransferase